MTTLYDMEFFVDPVDDATAAQLNDDDVLIDWGPNYCTAHVLWPGDSAVDVARSALNTLASRGVIVRRLSDSVVSAADIADRCGVSRPTVSEWTKDPTFPVPHLVTRAPLWEWHAVRGWVLGRPRGKVDLADEPDTPSGREVDLVNCELAPHEQLRDDVVSA